MERKFVPVEKRGGGDAQVDNDVPAHLRNDFPHSGQADAKTKDNGRASDESSCLSSLPLDQAKPHLVICLLHGLTSVLLMQEHHQAAAWQLHPSLFQQKLVLIDDSSGHLLESDCHFLTPDPLFCCFDLSVHVMCFAHYSVRLRVRLALLDLMHFFVVQVNVVLRILVPFAVVYFSRSYDGSFLMNLHGRTYVFMLRPLQDVL